MNIWPTFDLFYGGNRVARLESSQHEQVQELLDSYQFINSKLDLFSENTITPWGEVRDMTKTPRTTNRFLPGYDWGSNKGFFDATADRMEKDFEFMYENWTPPVDDDEK